MDYMQLVTDAWRIMWQRPRLWLLGILAGLGACNTPSTPSFSVNYRTDWPFADGRDGFPDITEAQAARAFEQAAAWLAENWWVPAVAVLAFLLLVLAVMAVGVLARGALVAATRNGNASAMSLGAAWGRGLAVFWRLAGLFLTLFLLVLPLLLLGIGMFLAGLSAAMGGDAGGVLPWLLGVAGLVFLPVVVYATVVQIIGLYAEREVVLLGAWPWEALRRGARLFRSNLGRSALVWLLWLGMSITASFIVGFGAAATLLITGGAGFLMGLALRSIDMPWAVSLLPGALLVLPVIGLLFLIGGALQTFWTAYWNLAWQRLQPAPALAGDAALPPPPGVTDGDDTAPPADGGTAVP